MSLGTRVPAAEGREETARWVRRMFGAVARRYDLLNHLLSFNLDRLWRKRTVRAVRKILERPAARVLDLCCGTGDLLFALQQHSAAPVFGCDFCHPMLVLAQRKAAQRGTSAKVFEGDALLLPLPDASFDLVTTAFGFRNLADYRGGLVEMARVLRPGGMAAILEFSWPPGRMMSALYTFYSNRILPYIGGLLSGSREAYSYLPESVKKFPSPEVLADEIKSSGFRQVRFTRMTFGIVVLHLAEK